MCVCLSVRGLGGGRFGLSWRRSRRCRRSGPGASRCAGLERAPFCEIYKILLGKKPPGAAATRRPALPPPPPSAPGRAAPPPRVGVRGLRYLPGRGLSPPRPRAPLEPRSRRETEKAAARPRSRERRGRREAAGAALAAEAAAGAQRREPEAETHRRERRESPAIVPVSVRPVCGPARPGARLPPRPAAGPAPRPAGRREGPAILGGGAAARVRPPGEGTRQARPG